MAPTRVIWRPRRERGEVQAELVGIWEQPNKQEAMVALATFKAEDSCLAIVWATMQDIRLHKIPLM